MAWLRIDDGFISNKKIAQLTDLELRVWLRVLCFSAEHRRQRRGLLTTADRREIAGLSKAKVERFRSLGLLDRSGNSGDVAVHDFEQYNPTDNTAAERKRKERERKAGGDVTRDTTRDEERDTGRDPSHMRESPYPYPKDQEQQQHAHPDPDKPEEPAAALEPDTWKILRTDLEMEGWADWQIARAEVDQARAELALTRALAEADTNAGGYAWRLFNTNGSIEKPEPKPTTQINIQAPYKPGKLRYLPAVTAIWNTAPINEREQRARIWLEGFTGNEEEIQAHIDALLARTQTQAPKAAA
jgi:hypothetical protein